MSKYLIVLLFPVLILGFGCGKKEEVKPTKEAVSAQAAEGAFHEMEKAYIARDMNGVMQRVSKDVEGGYGEFESRVRKDLELYGKVVLETHIERIEESDDQVKVVFNWYGKWWDAKEAVHEGRGNSVFVFKDAPGMPLVSIVGDSPFGVVR